MGLGGLGRPSPKAEHFFISILLAFVHINPTEYVDKCVGLLHIRPTDAGEELGIFSSPGSAPV